MLAVVKDQPLKNYISVKKIPSPPVAEKWVLVKVDLSGICGSDLHTYRWTPDYQQRFQGLLPVIVGHEYTGIVQEVGNGVNNLSPGDRVVSRTPISCGHCEPCLSGQEAICDHRQLLGVHYPGAMAEHVTVPARNCHKLSDDYSPKLAALSEPISISFGAMQKAGSTLGKNMVIIGPGSIGYFIAVLANMAGAARIFVLGLPQDKDRFTIFRKFIPNVFLDDNINALQSRLVKETGKIGADMVFEASGAPNGQKMALELTRKRGLIIQVGIISHPAAIDTNIAVRNEITIKGTPAIPERLWNRVLDLLSVQKEKQQMIFEAAITDIFPLSDAVKAFQKVNHGEGLKTLLSM